MTKRALKARDIERLENTSIASGLMGHAAMAGDNAHDVLVAHGHNAACAVITCDNYCSTICNTIQTTVGSVGGVGTPPTPQTPACLPVSCQLNTGQPLASLVCPTRDGCGPSFQGGTATC